MIFSFFSGSGIITCFSIFDSPFMQYIDLHGLGTLGSLLYNIDITGDHCTASQRAYGMHPLHSDDYIIAIEVFVYNKIILRRMAYGQEIP